ncbi:MAG: hypothetical protein M0008_02060 [Actinomycetota bacterium]|jgi:hypothetical protein|nr:hypothetical protein [Actinomycetota bacterium]
MSSAGKGWSKAKAVCPRWEHAGSQVRFTSVTVDQDTVGSATSVFQRTAIARTVSLSPWRARSPGWDDCEACERDVCVHEGLHAARNYQFVARGIAEALVVVGAG